MTVGGLLSAVFPPLSPTPPPQDQRKLASSPIQSSAIGFQKNDGAFIDHLSCELLKLLRTRLHQVWAKRLKLLDQKCVLLKLLIIYIFIE